MRRPAFPTPWTQRPEHRLIGRRVEANLNGCAEWALNVQSGLNATVGDVEVASSQPTFVYYQAGSRVGIRLKSRLALGERFWFCRCGKGNLLPVCFQYRP